MAYYWEYDRWEQEPEFLCTACEDLGWLIGPDDEIIPCTECCGEQTLDDIIKLETIEAA